MTTIREPQSAFSASYVSSLLGAKVLTWELLDGGRNSLVHRVITQNGDRYVTKSYLGTGADRRNRLAREFDSFQFLRKKGVDLVPRSIAADKSRACAVYEYIDGRKPSADRINEDDVDQATSFLAALHELRADEEATRLPSAMEACFSVQAVIDNIETRLAKLSGVSGQTPWYSALDSFLRDEFVPSFQEITSWCRQRVVVRTPRRSLLVRQLSESRYLDGKPE